MGLEGVKKQIKMLIIPDLIPPPDKHGFSTQLILVYGRLYKSGAQKITVFNKIRDEFY